MKNGRDTEIDALLNDPEYQGASRRVLNAWGAEIRERLQMAESASLPAQRQRRINRPSVSRLAGNHQSAIARRAASRRA